MRVKFFSTTRRGPVWSRYDPVAAIEQAVNDWLADNPTVRVTAVHQSVAGGSLNPPTFVVSVWYEPDAAPAAGG